MKTTVIIVAAALVAGCAQDYAGITRADVVLAEDGSVRSASFVDGKEKASAALSLALPSGLVVTYSASEVRAFEAHAVRAAVHQALLETMGEAAPEVVAAVTRAVIGSQVLGAAKQAAEGKAALEAARLRLEAEKARAGTAWGLRP